MQNSPTQYFLKLCIAYVHLHIRITHLFTLTGRCVTPFEGYVAEVPEGETRARLESSNFGVPNLAPPQPPHS